MSTYLCDCRKCTNAYYLERPDGAAASWCRPTVDNGESPLIVDGTCGADFVISCPCFTTDPAARAPLPDRYAEKWATHCR